ncbi:MAG: hypothetical protein R3A80_10255 [Bdellovibrionota bacterium]
MTGFPFPNSSNKWTGMAEAKHPLIQDLIKLWEESPGYILPQSSFIKDRTKLEAFIDSLIEAQKQKSLAPVKTPAPQKAKMPEPAEKKSDEDWEKNLASALALTKVELKKNEGRPSVHTNPIPANTGEFLKVPLKAQEKLAALKIVETLPPVDTNAPKVFNYHLIILYAVSMSAFILSLVALKR